MAEQAVGLVYDPSFLLHDAGPVSWGPPGTDWPYEDRVAHWESPQRIARVVELLNKGGLAEVLLPLVPREAEIAELCLVHLPSYIERVADLDAGGGGDAGEGAWVAPGTFRIARLAAGACLSAVDAVMAGNQMNAAYALVRPPGHHALPDRGMGYCIFNNVAVAARYALDTWKLERVAIVDWDVHHGNGTQVAFWDEPRVLFISLHQEGLFPQDSGAVHEVGGPNAKGLTVNVPLPAGSGEAVYQLAFEEVVAPILRRHRPDLILVSSGQDCGFNETIGRMCLSTGSFYRLTCRLCELTAELCEGRLVFVQEGGYNLLFMPFGALATFEALLGRRSSIQDPIQLWVDRFPSNLRASPDQVAAVMRVRQYHDLDNSR